MNRIVLVYVLLIVYLAVGLTACRDRLQESLGVNPLAPSALAYEQGGEDSLSSAALTPSLEIGGDL